MYRQGDILIVPVAEDAVPQAIRDLPPVARDGRGRMVLALGEATGHAHALTCEGTLRRDPDPFAPDYLHLPAADASGMRSTRRSRCPRAGTAWSGNASTCRAPSASSPTEPSAPARPSHPDDPPPFGEP
ncbi:hypothetical protein AB0J52_07680 [Spirillospora sp. NPDC049652]